MKFKIGDIVRFTKEMDGKLHGPEVKFDTKERKIVEISDFCDPYRLEGLPSNLFRDEELELVPCFKVGDIVKVNKNATIEDFTKNWWGGCQIDTLEFLKFYFNLDKEYEVVGVSDTSLRLKDVLDEADINKNIFEVVRRKETHEMTVKEIEEKLGITGLKIVKEYE